MCRGISIQTEKGSYQTPLRDENTVLLFNGCRIEAGLSKFGN